MVKVELELVGELKNHGDLEDAALSPQVKEELKNHMPMGYEVSESMTDRGFFIIYKTSFPRSRLVEGEELHLKFAHINNYYSGKFKIKKIPDNIDIQSEIPISMIHHDQSGGGKRKRKKSRPKRKKSKMKRR